MSGTQRRQFGALLIIAVAAVAMLASGANAQQAPTGEVQAPQRPNLEQQQTDEHPRQGVLERSRPEFDPLGLREGDFLILPSLGTAMRYDSNIFALPKNKIGGFAGIVSPLVEAKSDWNVHAVDFRGGADVVRNIDHSTEDVTNFNVQGSGRYDISREQYFNGFLSFQQGHEDRGSPNANNGVEPTPYTVKTGSVGYYRGVGRVNLTLNGELDRYDFDPVALASGGNIKNELRDRTEINETARVGYEIIPDYQAFIRGIGSQRSYDSNKDVTGPIPGTTTNFNRTSNGYTIVGGTAFELGAVTNGEVYAGYMQRFYNASNLGTPGGAVFGGSVLWNVTRLTSLRFKADRTIEESTLVGSSSYLLTYGQASVEHELLRNVLLTGSFSVSDIAYQGVSRDDKVYEGVLGAKYLMNRNFDVSLQYTFIDRTSNVSGVNYTRNVVLVKLTSKL